MLAGSRAVDSHKSEITHGQLHRYCAHPRAGSAAGRRAIHGDTGHRDRGRLPPLGRLRQVGEACLPLAGRRHRAHADQRRTALFLQVCERPSQEHVGGVAHGDRVRRAVGCCDRLSDVAVRDDLRHGAAHRRHFGAGGTLHGASPLPGNGAHRQWRAKRIPGGCIPSYARHTGAAAVRYRFGGDGEAQAQPRIAAPRGSHGACLPRCRRGGRRCRCRHHRDGR